MSIDLPLFPLRSVLCPGVALPLHIFEDRYRLMIGRCLERGEPFGVVLVREGHEVGPLRGRIADVGTTAIIRRAGRYPDGRLDILTVGERRFHLDALDARSQPYLVGRVTMLDEPSGPGAVVAEQAQRVGRRFLRYLELLQPATDSDGPEIEIEIEVDADEDDEQDTFAAGLVRREAPSSDLRPVEGAEPLIAELDAADLSPEQRHELLMTAARRLTATDDPTALSYVLTALVQVDLSARQVLLETPDTLSRLRRLERLLERESWHLGRSLRPIVLDPAFPSARRN
jgi:Lon protease-like protein